MARKFSGSSDSLINRLSFIGIEIVHSKRLNHGVQLHTECGVKISLFNNGTLQFQGANAFEVEERWDYFSENGEVPDVC